MGKNNTKILKLANRYLVLQCISAFEPITIEDIVKKTNLSRPTVLNAVKELMDEDVVMKDGQAESTGGRTAALLSTNKNAYYAVGVDFEFPQVRLAIANLKGEVLAADQFDYPLDSSAAAIIEHLPDFIAGFVENAGVERSKLEGIGLGLSGILDIHSGKSRAMERIRGWENVDIRRMLEDKLALPVYVRNDVHLLGLVEKRFFQPEMDDDFIYIGLRSGIGSAVFLKNKIYEGAGGNAGFIGHMMLDVDGPEGFGGPRGSLNVFAGEVSLINRYRQSVSSLRVPAGAVDRGEMSEAALPKRLYDLVRLSEEGDGVAKALLSEAGYYLGMAVINLVHMFEIPQIVIGGCLDLEASPLIQAVQETVNANLRMHGEPLHIRCGQLSEQQYALGGCFLVFDHVFQKPKLKLQI